VRAVAYTRVVYIESSRGETRIRALSLTNHEDSMSLIRFTFYTSLVLLATACMFHLFWSIYGHVDCLTCCCYVFCYYALK
jgi:hypothetical protein